MKKISALCLLAFCASSVAADMQGSSSKAWWSRSSESSRPFYVGFESGVVIPVAKASTSSTPLLDNTKFNTTALYGLNAGYRVTDFFRTEIDFQARSMNYSASAGASALGSAESVKQNTKNWNVFWNGYLEAKNSSIFTPYLTGGIGYSRLLTGRAENTLFTTPEILVTFPGQHTNNFAWNVGIGSRVNLTGGLDFDAAVKYVDLGRVRFGVADNDSIPGDSVRIANIEVVLGLSYNF